MKANECLTVRDAIEAMARLRPDSSFLSSPETHFDWTYEELRRLSIELGARLFALGLSRGDKIAFMMDNGLYTAGLLLGSMYSGLVCVPLNVRAGRSQIAYMLEHSDAKVVFVSEHYDQLLEELQTEITREIRVIRADVDHGPDWGESTPPVTSLPEIDPDQEALLIYTSGSTGQPKGAIHTHRKFIAAGWNSAIPHELTCEDRSLCLLPLYHINAETVTLMATLLTGGCVVMPHRFLVRNFWHWIAEYRCSWSALVPTIISQLLDWEDPRANGMDEALARIRFFRSSSAPLAPSLHRAFEEKFGLLLIEAMGSTECCGNIFSNPLPPGKDKIGTPGRPYGFELRILSPDGTEAPQGEAGQIQVRGPSVMTGYYKNPEETSAVLTPDGWWSTGDLAYVDEDGYVFIVGRAKELIIKGGMNVSPRQIDDVLVTHPAVLDAAALGVPDHYLGEDIVAFVTLKSGVEAYEQEILRFCEAHLGPFKTPSRIFIVHDLPKGSTGKVQRLRLNECFKEILEAYPLKRDEPPVSPIELGSASSQSAHSDPVAEIVAEIWSRYLKIPSVGVEDNFFSLGGHSLLAIEILFEIRRRFTVSLSVNDFFTKPTVVQQAALLKTLLGSEEVRPRTPSSESSGGASEARELDRKDLEALLSNRSKVASAEFKIPLRDRSLNPPLSPAQQRLWFLERLHPGLLAYNEGEAARFSGELDPTLLERSLNLIVDRHEVLRTLVQEVDGELVQVVQESWPIKLEIIDLSGLASEERERHIERLLVEIPQRPFDLTQKPGIRASLVRVSPQDHVLFLMLHHLVCDGWSLGMLYRELEVIHRALRRSKTPDLPEASLQYGDYATWQQSKVLEHAFEREEAFWKEYLHGAPDAIDLPMKQVRPETFTYQGEKRVLSLGRENTARFRDLSRSEGVSLFTSLTAIFNTLLYRYSGQDDVVIGVPIANRDRAELATLFGFLIDFQALRTDLSGNPTFRQLLRRSFDGLLQIQENRALPFEKVVEIVRPQRDPSRAPLFQTMLIWKDRDVQMQFMELDGLTTSFVMSHPRSSKFDLTLFLTDAGDEVLLEVEYCTDLFDLEVIERMVGHFRQLVEGAVADPEVHIDDLPLLTAEERRQVLVEWNDTYAELPSDSCVQDVFESQARLTPGQIAVECEGMRLTYAELKAKSDLVESRLRALGVGTDDLVGLCFDRSLEMVVGLLGILKAGGAYLPLDPAFPRDRLSMMIEDANPRVILTQERLQDSLPSSDATVVVLESSKPPRILRQGAVSGDSAGPRDAYPSQSPDSLAYVLFTSGSTGRPKGVQISQKSLVNLLSSMRREPGLTAEDRLLSVSTLSFDISTLELLLPLTTGATVVVATREIASDGQRLAQLIHDSQATVMQATPATWRMLQQIGWTGCPRLKILCGGEALARDLADWLLQRCSQLWNLYGPTETTIWSAAWRVTAVGPILIGKPIDNTQCYIVDRHFNPVPVGLHGELLLGGTGLARGYINRQELTDEKFIPNRFTDDSRSRLYRTGDLCRWRDDGNVEFLGRIDHQVKLRGFRIELGEIEAVLREHSSVAQAVVQLRPSPSGGDWLVAYCVLTEGAAWDTAALKVYLRAKLPDYMIPSAYVHLEELPLTPNGKIDRKSLPEPSTGGTANSPSNVAPRTEIERRLVAIWTKALKREQVGIHDNFFDLGGHSLLVTSLFTRIEQEFGKSLPLATMFKAPTIAGLAKEIVSPTATRAYRAGTGVDEDRGRKPRIFVLHGIDGDLGQWRALSDRLSKNVDVFGLKLPERDGQTQAFSEIEAAASYHVASIRSIEPNGPYHILGYSYGSTVALEIAQQLLTLGCEVGLLGVIDSGPAPADRDREPVPSDIWSVSRNVYHWLKYDLLATRPKGILERVSRRLRRDVGRARPKITPTSGTSQYWRLQDYLAADQPSDHMRHVIETNYHARMIYTPKPYLGRLTLFRAGSDPLLRPRALDLGWGGLIIGGVDIVTIEANHINMMQEPRVDSIAEHVLERVCLLERKSNRL